MKAFLKKRGKFYSIVINKKNTDGTWKKKWISTKTTNERDAKKELKKVLEKYELEEKKIDKITNNNSLNKNSIKFYELMDIWLNKVIKNSIEETTYDGYCTNINMHIIPYFKKKNILVQNLTTLDLNEFFNYKYEYGRLDNKGGLSANFIKKIYHNINKALEYAVHVLKIILDNPAKNVSLPKVKNYIPSYYTLQELEKLLEVTKETLIESSVYIAVNYGLRRGEVLGLRWKDINFIENTLFITNTRTKVKRTVEKMPKTKSSIRKLPLMKHVREYLLKLKKKQKQEKLFLGKAYFDNDYVCRYSDGKPVNLNTLSHSFSRILKRNNLRHIRFHDLRHSTGTYLVKLGISLTLIKSWMGHSDIKTTYIYTHTDLSMKEEVGNKITDFFENKNLTVKFL